VHALWVGFRGDWNKGTVEKRDRLQIHPEKHTHTTRSNNSSTSHTTNSKTLTRTQTRISCHSKALFEPHIKINTPKHTQVSTATRGLSCRCPCCPSHKPCWHRNHPRVGLVWCVCVCGVCVCCVCMCLHMYMRVCVSECCVCCCVYVFKPPTLCLTSCKLQTTSPPWYEPLVRACCASEFAYATLQGTEEK
jgi:hypothetical protein